MCVQKLDLGVCCVFCRIPVSLIWYRINAYMTLNA